MWFPVALPLQIVGKLPRKDRNFKEISSNWIDHPILKCDNNGTCDVADQDFGIDNPLFAYIVVRRRFPGRSTLPRRSCIRADVYVALSPTMFCATAQVPHSVRLQTLCAEVATHCWRAENRLCFPLLLVHVTRASLSRCCA